MARKDDKTTTNEQANILDELTSRDRRDNRDPSEALVHGARLIAAAVIFTSAANIDASEAAAQAYELEDWLNRIEDDHESDRRAAQELVEGFAG
jgi:hypothetical protein